MTDDIFAGYVLLAVSVLAGIVVLSQLIAWA